MCVTAKWLIRSRIVCQYQKHVQNLEPNRWHGEEVDGHHAFHVVLKACGFQGRHATFETAAVCVEPCTCLHWSRQCRSPVLVVHRGSSERPRVDSRGSSCGSVRGLRRAPSGDRIGHDESSMSRTCEIPGDAIPLRWKLARCGCRTSNLSRQNRGPPAASGQQVSASAASLSAAGRRSGGEAQESQVEAQRDCGTNLKTKL